MKFVKTIFAVFALTLLGATLAPGARADEWNKKTVMTFSQAVEIPGQILPAGTYTFVLLDSPSDRHIVQIFNADGSHIITTVLAINNYRLKPTGDTVVKFAERSGDNPEALKGWFYPGDNFGQEFVYPKQRAIELALMAKEPIPALAADNGPESGPHCRGNSRPEGRACKRSDPNGSSSRGSFNANSSRSGNHSRASR